MILLEASSPFEMGGAEGTDPDPHTASHLFDYLPSPCGLNRLLRKGFRTNIEQREQARTKQMATKMATR